MEKAHHLHIEAEGIEVGINLLARHVVAQHNSVVGGVEDGLLGLTNSSNCDSKAHQTAQFTGLVILDKFDMTSLCPLDEFHGLRQVAHRVGVVEIELRQVIECRHIIGRLGVGFVERGEPCLVVD